MSFAVAAIVEGHGDVVAVPHLIRRLAPSLRVERPVRMPRTRLLQPVHLRRAAAIAASNVTGHGALLLVLDADEDCAATLAPRLAGDLVAAAPSLVCRVALAVREFEAWAVAGDAAFDVTDADRAGNLKGMLRARHGVYKESVDQVRRIADCDVELAAARSRSFRHFQKAIAEIAQAAEGSGRSGA